MADGKVGAPEGNQNAARGKVWRAAINRALERLGGKPDDGITRSPQIIALDQLADTFVANCKAGDLGFFKEFGDRVEGKAPQQLQLQGDENEPLRIVHESK